ncbi:MAG: peptide ABC transporter substrate-binding protein [Anaerolineae bacterium]|nr:peptide ABC transporter substrate-binding protein [Anaerolineae bacterium]
MYSKKWTIVLGALLAVSMLLSACATPTPEEIIIEVTKIVEGETVVEQVVVTATPEPAAAEMRDNVLHVSFGPGDVPTLDPSLGTDTSSIQVVEELTIGLVRLHEETLAVDPGMAVSWDLSDDGQTYTFHLLEGIPWVRWNGNSVEEVLDADGNVRYVTAHDFEYGTKRTVDPDTGSSYAYVLGMALAGVEEYLYAENWNDLTDEEKAALRDGVGIKALDDYTLEMTFLTKAAYNLNIAGMWVARAEPQWLIEEKGDRWSEPGFSQSYGPYALKEWVHDSVMTIVVNPFWPGIESVPQPIIEEIQFSMLDQSAAFAEYEAGNLEVAAVPSADIDRVKADPMLSEELIIAPDGCAYYYGFNTEKAPVDNVHMRRALSYAVDRTDLVENVTKGGQQPAQWFCRPGMAGCPYIDPHPGFGITSNADEAKAELALHVAAVGYTDDSEISEVQLMHNTSEGHKKIAEAIAEMWHETLGIQPTVTNQEWKVYLKTIRSEDVPTVWRLGWCLDYPDANNFTREVFSKGGSGNPEVGGLNWLNEDFEQIVLDAAVESDPVKRVEMYAEAENILVYEDAAVLPIYWYTMVNVTKPYVNRTYSNHGHDYYEKWSLELEK